MLVPEIKNFNQNLNFKGYSISPKGKNALKKLTDPAIKQGYIDMCRRLESKKYSNIEIDASDKGEILTYLKIPEIPEKILAIKGRYSQFSAPCHYWEKYDNLVINGYYDKTLMIRYKDKMYEINFPNKEFIGPLADLGEIDAVFSPFKKIELLCDNIENLHLYLKKAEDLNKEIDLLV